MARYQSAGDPPGSGIPSSGGLGQGSSGAFASIPINTSIPVISGTPQVGSLLITTPGIWNNVPTSFAYQWVRGVTNVGTNQNSYTPVVGDIGSAITVLVTATNSIGSSLAATSAATSAVIASSAGMLDFSQASDSSLIAAVMA